MPLDSTKKYTIDDLEQAVERISLFVASTRGAIKAAKDREIQEVEVAKLAAYNRAVPALKIWSRAVEDAIDAIINPKIVLKKPRKKTAK